MYIYMHSYTHITAAATYMNKYVTYTKGYTNICSYVHISKHTYMHTYLRTCIQSYTHTHKHTYMHTNVHTNIHTCILTYILINIHTYWHAYILSTCMYIRIYKCLFIKTVPIYKTIPTSCRSMSLWNTTSSTNASNSPTGCLPLSLRSHLMTKRSLFLSLSVVSTLFLTHTLWALSSSHTLFLFSSSFRSSAVFCLWRTVGYESK